MYELLECGAVFFILIYVITKIANPEASLKPEHKTDEERLAKVKRSGIIITVTASLLLILLLVVKFRLYSM